jgi:hypothetical protein
MGCGCNNRREPEVSLLQQLGYDPLDANEWGPILWRYLHCLAEKIGYTDESNVNSKYEASCIFYLLDNLYLVIPCNECQAHAREYISTYCVNKIENLRGSELRKEVRKWLFDFHTAVRLRKGQPVILSTVQECSDFYRNATISSDDYTKYIQCVAAAAREKIIKINHWRKWYNMSEQLKQILGNVVV